MLQMKPEQDDQVTTFPPGETAGLTSLSGVALTSVSGPPGFEMLPTMISPGEPSTNATVSPPSAVAPAGAGTGLDRVLSDDVVNHDRSDPGHEVMRAKAMWLSSTSGRVDVVRTGWDRRVRDYRIEKVAVPG